MIAGYGLFGLFSVLALVVNIAIVIACLSLFHATLTLPGIAGIVLTMGVAVDANVLIYERIREEMKAGRNMIASIEAGFDRAYGTIIDSHLTGLLAAVILYAFGSGTVRGFAVTLSFGIVSSLFTAITVTRLMVSTWLRQARPAVPKSSRLELTTMLKPLFRLPQRMNLRFVKYFKLCLALSIVAIVGTMVLLPTIGLNFGIDFKGGTLIQIQTPTAADASQLRTALSKLGLGEIQLQSFGSDKDFLIRFPEQPGGPDAQKLAAEKVLAAVPAGSNEARREQVGSTVSKELIAAAIWALVFTNLGIFAYVWFRFEWQFAIGAVVSMIHDVMFTLGVFAFFRLDFDLTIVAALLTILGYSINDTVVIYDRIRENLRRYKRMPLGDLLDLSVNETMSRTIMTVGTVFMALLALYFFGGEVIRGFTFAMLFGVLVGTYSSVFIAAPFLILIGVKRDWSGLEKGKDGKKSGTAGAAAIEARLSGGGEAGEDDAEGGKPGSQAQAEASKAAFAAVAARKGSVQRSAASRARKRTKKR